jgi:phosphate transport system substrate-binding protein
VTTRTRRPVRTLLAFMLVFLLAGGFASAFDARAAYAATYVPITGTGSTWSQNALDQWRKNVAANYGMTVNYTGSGSSAGRQDFIAGSVDFAISEIPFQSKPEDGSAPERPTTPFAYMPIVAGGTSFMYNLNIGGKRVTGLRLAGETVTKIFTGVITNWNDPQIVSDNPGLAMPDKAIVPVVRSDGSGSSAQFSLWMSKQHPALWSAYKCGGQSPCGLTSQYPTPANGKAQSGSLGVAGYVSQSYGEGAITYVEYSYALKSGFPVAQVLNASGSYVLPTGAAVAVALQKAVINTTESSPDYLTQDLTGVYNSADPVAYPLSSYSYMIVPTATTGNFTTQKGTSLSTFSNYMLCEGQKQAEVLGYSPLPENLVMAGLEQVKRIPGASPAASTCAPGSIVPPPTAESGAAAAAAAAAAADAASTGSADGTVDAADGSTVAATYDENGALVSGGASGGAVSSPFTLADSGFGGSQFVMLFAGILVLAAVALPPVLSKRLKRGGAKNP